MQSQPCLELSQFSDTPLKILTNQADLLKMMESSLEELQRIYNSNIELMDLPKSQWGGRVMTYIPDKVVLKVGSLSLRTCAGHSEQTVSSINRDLAFLIANQKDVMTAVREGKLFPYTFVNNIDWQMSYRQLSISRTFEGTLCPDCGHVQNFSSLKSHRSSMKCLQATHDRDLREAGWSQIEHTHYGTAIRKAGVQWDIRASEYKMWIPPWVANAIRQYEENKGYGGLRLEIFLAKMKPDNV